MGSIPLVASFPTEQTPMPRTPLEAYARATSLQGMIQDNAAVAQQTEQRAQEFPVQQQQQEEILKQQQMQNAAAERDAQDQQVIHQTLAANGGDIGKSMPELAQKISAKNYMGVADAHLKIRKEIADLSESELKAQAAKHDQFLGLIDFATQLPPDQYQQQFPALIQKAQQVDPEATKGLNSQQFIPQSELKYVAMGLQAHTAAIADKLKEADIADKMRGDFQEQEFAAYKKNPDVDKGMSLEKRDQATFLSWKAKQSPTMLVMGNMLGQAGEGSALDQSAQRYLQTGELPSGFSRSPGTTAAIVKRAAELGGGQNIAANKATTKADSTALSKLQTQADQVGAFENTALKNLDLFLEKAKAIPDLGARFADVPLRMISNKMIGDKDFAAFNAARQTALTETAKVLSSANASGVLSDSARHEVDEILSGNLPFPAMEQVVLTLKQDMKNRHDSYQQDISAIKGRLGAGGGNTDSKTPPANGPTDFFSQFGGKPRQ